MNILEDSHPFTNREITYTNNLFKKYTHNAEFFLISNFHCIVNAVFFLLGDSLAPEFYVSTFWNTQSVPSS